MTATDELRRLLDERGVKWWEAWDKDLTIFDGAHGVRYTADHTLGEWFIRSVLPITAEQVIAATLGSGREAELQKALNKAAGNWAKTDAELRKALDFMRIWISDDAHLGESDVSYALERAEGLRKLDAIESAIAATLGGGECECDGSIEWEWTGPTTYYEHELSCGHVITSVDNELPNYCEICGAKVRKVRR